MTGFVANIVENLTIGLFDTRVGLVVFGNKATPAFYLNTYTNRTEVVEAIMNIPFKDQETNTSGALWFTREIMLSFQNGNRPGIPDVVIVMTDGESTRDSQYTIRYAEELLTLGTTPLVLAIGVGQKVSFKELYAIATNSSFVYSVDNFDLLPVLNTRIQTVACDIPVGKLACLPFSQT